MMMIIKITVMIMMMMMMMPGTFFHGVHLKTIEDNNSKLEDILDSVHLGYCWYSDPKWTRKRKDYYVFSVKSKS